MTDLRRYLLFMALAVLVLRSTCVGTDQNSDESNIYNIAELQIGDYFTYFNARFEGDTILERWYKVKYVIEDKKTSIRKGQIDTIHFTIKKIEEAEDTVMIGTFQYFVKDNSLVPEFVTAADIDILAAIKRKLDQINQLNSRLTPDTLRISSSGLSGDTIFNDWWEPSDTSSIRSFVVKTHWSDVKSILKPQAYQIVEKYFFNSCSLYDPSIVYREIVYPTCRRYNTIAIIFHRPGLVTILKNGEFGLINSWIDIQYPFAIFYLGEWKIKGKEGRTITRQ